MLPPNPTPHPHRLEIVALWSSKGLNWKTHGYGIDTSSCFFPERKLNPLKNY